MQGLNGAIGILDGAIIVGYFVLIVGLGCWVGLHRRRGAESNEYFLAGNKLGWPTIGLALFSTNISTVHLVSQAEEGYINGLAYGNFEWMAVFTLIALSLFFAPFYLRSRIATLPDFLEKRYNKACRHWLAILSIIVAIVFHIGFSLYTGAIVLKGLFGFPIMTSIIGISLLTGLYTIIGGLMAVVLTESLQTIILLAGAIIITLIGYLKVGGWDGLTAHVDPVKLTMLRSAEDPAHLPWYAVLLGYPVIGLYWCTDQTIVQRVLGARDENQARIGPLFTAFLKILPVFIFVLPGTICLALIHQGKLPPLADSRNTYAHMITHLVPTGLKGIIAAALLAALMSTVSGALNAIATLFSYDIYRHFRPDSSDHRLVVIGRIVTFIAMIFAIIWSPAISHYESIYQGSNTLICYIAPPITVVFLWGIFWRRATPLAAMTTLYTGSFLGLVVTLLDWYKVYTHWPISFMMAAFYLFVLCSAILVAVSLWKPQPLTSTSEELVWKSPFDPLRGPAGKGWGNYKLLSGLLLAIMIALYTIFR